MGTALTVLIALAVLALFLWALVFSVRTSKRTGCSRGCSGCPWSELCRMAENDRPAEPNHAARAKGRTRRSRQ